MRNRELVEDLCSGCSRRGHECAYRDIFTRSTQYTRALVQVKCIERWGKERSAANSEVIEGERAAELWISDGYAEKFAHVYREEMCVLELYERIMTSN